MHDQRALCISDEWLNFRRTEVFKKKIFLELVNNNNIFFSFATHFKSSLSITSRELRQQFATCAGIVNEDDNNTCIFRLEKVSWVLHFKNYVYLDLRINSILISSYTMQLEWRTTMKLPSTAGLYVAFRTIMIISRQQKSWSRDYSLLLSRYDIKSDAARFCYFPIQSYKPKDV